MPISARLSVLSSGRKLQSRWIYARPITRLFPLLCVFIITFAGNYLWSWGSKPHSQIVDAALAVVSEKDHVPQRLGEEAWRLRYYVLMADWRDCFVSASENWTIRTAGYREDHGGFHAQFYANDYLLFPAAPSNFNHIVPGVLGSYRPFFLRALQALRTESPSNAARWIGSLLHFVTDSGSPPHAAGIRGDLHTKMENWLDASSIDLSGYDPQLLGKSDAEAAQGLVGRMNGLIEFSKLRAERLVPLAEANDRSHVEPISLESATETAKVTADVLHTLFTLSGKAPDAQSSSLVAEVSAPPFAGMDLVPAKLMLLGTNYSTLSELSANPSHAYRGSFSFRNLPPGTYQGVVERIGARPLFVGPLVLRPGQTLHLSWELQPGAPAGNLIRNPDFSTFWLAPDVPDHWQFDKLKSQWMSDLAPIEAGERYSVGYGAKGPSTPTVQLQWMEAWWKPLDTQPVTLPPTSTLPTGTQIVAPEKAFFARFIVDGAKSPADSVQLVFLTNTQ